MEMLEMTPDFWRNRTVLITGHTGFKGGWLAVLLNELGAKVHGYSLPPPSQPSFFEVAHISKILTSHTIGDIRVFEDFRACLTKTEPEVVFHLAAQPLVRASYENPIETYTTNVIGSLNILESIRVLGGTRAIVNVTTDKCYENNEWPWRYRENDRLGGYDPYSSSKACSEILTSSFRQSFFNKSKIFAASARAGNVLGGGDWSKDRLIPDFFRAVEKGVCLSIRSPGAIRPWQHVLEPLSGYLLLAQSLIESGHEFADSWNFGPDYRGEKSVKWILEELQKNFSTLSWKVSGEDVPHEASFLRLDSSKAMSGLGWAPRWSLDLAINKTVEWHRCWKDGREMYEVSQRQIASYLEQI